MKRDPRRHLLEPYGNAGAFAKIRPVHVVGMSREWATEPVAVPDVTGPLPWSLRVVLRPVRWGACSRCVRLPHLRAGTGAWVHARRRHGCERVSGRGKGAGAAAQLGARASPRDRWDRLNRSGVRSRRRHLRTAWQENESFPRTYWPCGDGSGRSGGWDGGSPAA